MNKREQLSRSNRARRIRGRAGERKAPMAEEIGRAAGYLPWSQADGMRKEKAV